jgi:hypothetical protein
MKTKLILGITLFFITSSVFCQTNRQYIDTGSVINQFDYLINKSNRYKDYKVVKINWLEKLKSNVTDSLSASEKEILTNYSLINSQKNSIDSLNLTLNNSERKIASLNAEIQSISLFGVEFKKPMFKIIMFLIIGTLTVLLLVFITKFKRSNAITIQTKLTLKEVEAEFEEHRKIALEREQKVRRQLQDELNKQKKD